MLPAAHRAFFAAGQVERLAQRVAARIGEAVQVSQSAPPGLPSTAASLENFHMAK
jgi:hypothetical protein